MQKVEAYIQPYKLDEVKDGLFAIGVQGISISEVRGHGRQKGHSVTYRGAEYSLDLIPKVKLEVFVTDAIVERVVDTISGAAKTGKIGDGKIFVFPVAEAVRIRNGERGDIVL